MISQSPFCTQKLISAFNLDRLGKENIILETGYPRNDELFNYSGEKVERIKESFNIPEDKLCDSLLPYVPR